MKIYPRVQKQENEWINLLLISKTFDDKSKQQETSYGAGLEDQSRLLPFSKMKNHHLGLLLTSLVRDQAKYLIFHCIRLDITSNSIV